ncbi:MAG: DNA polymerase III subunit gamma/tau [Ottowia sp.]|nr:DNA polymerase III subunit gamma/tau [Ottowia sp.]
MSYVVLARKYRPRHFGEVVGQEHVVQALTHALEQQRLHHAYLFVGTRGIGKTTLSRILAKSLNCTGADGQGDITAEPCGQCPACLAIDAGRFVDYTELDAASNRGVDEVQGLLEQAVYKPVQGRFKVFMIDEVHMLSSHAFNAMLKTLEEPPEYLKFVLATTDPQKVPVTVLSRCLQFNLRQMAPEIIAEQLQHVLEQEQVAAEPAALQLLARAARGSMRDALSLTDQAIAYGSGQLQAEPVRQMLGSADRDLVFEFIAALAASDGAAVMRGVDALRRSGQSAAATLEDMAGILQRMAVLQLASDYPDQSSDPDAVRMAELARRLPADETQLLYSLCLHGRNELGLAPDEYVGLSMALLRLLPFRATAAGDAQAGTAQKKTLKTPVRQPDAAASAAAAQRDDDVAEPAAAGQGGQGEPAAAAGDAGPEHVAEPARAADPGSATADAAESDAAAGLALEPPEPAVASSAPAAAENEAAPASSAASGDFWAQLVQQLVRSAAVKALPRQLALQSQLLARSGSCWTLRVENQSLASAAVRERLEAALADQGHPVRLELEFGSVSDSPAKRRAAARARRLADAEALLMADPFVQKMMRDFDARVVPGSIQPL